MWRDDFETFCHENNIVINLSESLSTRIRGFCYYDGEYYNVILNAKLSSAQLKKTTVHEIIHVMENHFECSPEYIDHTENEVQHIIEEIRYAWG